MNMVYSIPKGKTLQDALEIEEQINRLEQCIETIPSAYSVAVDCRIIGT